MSARQALWLTVCALAFLGTVGAFEKPFRQYPGTEYTYFETRNIQKLELVKADGETAAQE